MAIYRLPPSPFVGGRQPLAPKDLNSSAEAVEVNDPPSRSNATLLVAILIAWQPVSIPPQPQRFTPQVAAEVRVPYQAHPEILIGWMYPEYSLPQLPRKLPVYVTAIDNPPFTSRTTLPALIAWTPPPPQPWFGYKLNPALEAVEVNDPPFTSRTNLPSIISSWIPPQPQPQLNIKLVTGFAAEEKIPYKQYQPPYYTDYSIPQLPRKLPVDVIAVPENDPPFSSRNNLNTILTWWIPSPQPVQPLVKLVTAAEEKVPFTRHPEIFISWIPSQYQPQANVKFISEFVAEKVPYNRYQPTWFADYVNPQLQRKLVPETVVAEKIPYNRYQFNSDSYLVPVLLPVIKKLNPDSIAVPTNDPPFGQRIWLNNIVRAWEPPPPLPTVPNSGFSPIVNNIILWMWKRTA